MVDEKFEISLNGVDDLLNPVKNRQNIFQV